MKNWTKHPFIVIGALFALWFGVMSFIIYENSTRLEDQQQKFMHECLADKKQYECDYMWRTMLR